MVEIGKEYKIVCDDENGNNVEFLAKVVDMKKNDETGLYDILLDNRMALYDCEMTSQVETVECQECGGSGFSGQGTGYDSVCDNCGGKGEVLNG